MSTASLRYEAGAAADLKNPERSPFLLCSAAAPLRLAWSEAILLAGRARQLRCGKPGFSADEREFSWGRQHAHQRQRCRSSRAVLNAGNKLVIRCTYNNTLDNLNVAAPLAEQGLAAPHDVRLGETTLDEMCLASVSALYPAAQ
ncbi:MAG: hypothetical protein ABI627_08360 [Polyangiaceae bacterium]